MSSPVVARSKACVYGRSLAGTAGSNSATHSCECYVSLRLADHLSERFLPSVVCLSVIEEPRRGGLGPLGLSSSSSLVFSPKAGFGRNQSPVRRPVWLWRTAF